MSKKKKVKGATHSASSREPASPPDDAARAEADKIYRSETVAAPTIDSMEAAPGADAESDMSEFERKEEEVPPASPSKVEVLVQSGTALSETTLLILRGLMESSYEQQERNLVSLKKLLECRTPQDFSELQRNLLRDNLESFLSLWSTLLHRSAWAAGTWQPY
jgi:hypothetical protein